MYMLASSNLRAFFPGNTFPSSSVVTVWTTNPIPCREFGIVVFGATGFTGKRVMVHCPSHPTPASDIPAHMRVLHVMSEDACFACVCH